MLKNICGGNIEWKRSLRISRGPAGRGEIVPLVAILIEE